MKPVLITLCTVVTLLGLYAGTYVGSCSTAAFQAAYVREYPSGTPIQVFAPLAYVEATVRGCDVYLGSVRPATPGVTWIVVEAPPLW